MTDGNDDVDGGNGGTANQGHRRRRRSGLLGGTTQADQATAQIGDRLRKIYNDVLEEPIPDDFQALLDQLDEKEGQ